ncbi:MFS transporter [Pigmentiphaga aceris]|uniref:MFS transporter n=1 Tax=Pigmentiphaga aceris TaxID=1940612 RepID=A0A5C0AWG4_9BURK|nr:MFS transporter [Pigmentiphaga aceris]QEI06658.1 MFS transporter [Pigmentiphaga aceris]
MPSSSLASHGNTSSTLSPRVTFVLLTSILFTYVSASAAPTPLYGVYRDAWGFSPLMLTVAFAVYAFGLLASLLIVGSLSDHVGRRPVVLGAMMVEALALVLFLSAQDIGGLILARVVQGIATGAATTALGAALLDVDRVKGSVVNSIAPMVGMAIGALGTSLLVQYAPLPMHLSYALLLVTLVSLGIAAYFMPETVTRRPGAWGSLRPDLRVARHASQGMWKVMPLNASLWMTGGFYMSLGPSLARSVTHIDTPIIGGLLVCALTLSAGLVILILRNRDPRISLSLSSVMMVTGIGTTLIGVALGQALVLFGGTLLAGIGFGSGFLGAMRSIMPLAAPHERAGLLAVFYTLSYLAMSLPAMLAGLAASTIGLTYATYGYGLTIMVLASSAGIRTLRARFKR